MERKRSELDDHDGCCQCQWDLGCVALAHSQLRLKHTQRERSADSPLRILNVSRWPVPAMTTPSARQTVPQHPSRIWRLVGLPEAASRETTGKRLTATMPAPTSTLALEAQLSLACRRFWRCLLRVQEVQQEMAEQRLPASIGSARKPQPHCHAGACHASTVCLEWEAGTAQGLFRANGSPNAGLHCEPLGRRLPSWHMLRLTWVIAS